MSLAGRYRDTSVLRGREMQSARWIAFTENLNILRLTKGSINSCTCVRTSSANK